MRRTLIAAMMMALARFALAHGTGEHAKGTVNDVSATRIVAETAQGDRTFNVTPRTKFVKRGAAVNSSGVLTGDRVVVHGVNVSGALEATDVRAADSVPPRHEK